MKQLLIGTVLVGLAGLPLGASERPSISGSYVEARTAEVFTGGCIMASEAETSGREALLAWKVDRGTFTGVPLDGLSVVAAVAADKNLGIHELGGETAISHAAVFVDERANPAQRTALVAMAHALAGGVLSDIVQVTPVPIQFSEQADAITVSTSHVTLGVNKHLIHDAGCGAQQWFHPLAAVAHAELGTTERNAFSGSVLGTKWSDPNKPSAFFGTFSY